jgi:hypothetical protein
MYSSNVTANEVHYPNHYNRCVTLGKRDTVHIHALRKSGAKALVAMKYSLLSLIEFKSRKFYIKKKIILHFKKVY